MREIKFRAWWKRSALDLEEGKKPRMIYFGQMRYCDEYNHLSFDLEHVSREPDGPQTHNLSANSADFEVMQFTGLRDKNGKEIYEGDILCTSNEDPTYDIWDKEDYGFTQIIWDQEVDSWVGSKWIWDKNEDSIYSKEFIEVIGNIYETPELLNSKVS